MKTQKKPYRLAGLTLFIPTLTWYVYLLFTGTNSPRHTFIAILGIITLFGVSATFLALAGNKKLAFTSGVLAVLGTPLAFFIAGIAEAISWRNNPPF